MPAAPRHLILFKTGMVTMSYKSLLAHVCVGQDNSNVTGVSAALAQMFGAQVIGISGLRLSPPITPPYSGVPGAELTQYEQEADEQSLKAIEQDFRAAFSGLDISLSWRANCNFTPVSEFVAQEARAADLIVTSPEPDSFLERIGESHLGPLVLGSGRPVLVVPRQQRELKLNKVAIAWKDVREARRAAADALPLLQKAQEVSVVEICSPGDVEATEQRTADVVGWLKLHGVAARPIVEAWKGSDLDGLHAVLRRSSFDLVIAGAYGHTRLREWVFGGVTMDFLLSGKYSVLLSH